MIVSDLATVQVGYSFRTRLEHSENGNIAVIQMRDLLGDATVSCDNLAKVELSEVKERHFVQKGDLIFRSRGLISTSAILTRKLKKTLVAAPLLRVRVTKKDIILPQYLNWYISQSVAQAFLNSRSRYCAQKMIDREALNALPVLLPDMQKQKNIVELAKLARKEEVLVQKIMSKRKHFITRQLIQFAKENAL